MGESFIFESEDCTSSHVVKSVFDRFMDTLIKWPKSFNYKDTFLSVRNLNHHMVSDKKECMTFSLTGKVENSENLENTTGTGQTGSQNLGV